MTKFFDSLPVNGPSHVRYVVFIPAVIHWKYVHITK